jgi:hypothetical protein
MNKLVMMAVALVAAASSYAQCTPGEDPVVGPCAQVYTVEMTLKTTTAKSGSVETGDACTPGSTSVCYRVISSKSYKGYYYNCTCGCDEFVNNTLDVYNKKTDEMLVTAGTIDWDILGRIGKKNAEVEASGDVDGIIYLQGFGKYDSKNDRISSISGNVQTWYLAAPACTVDCAPGATAYPGDLCDPSIPLSVGTIGYGSFSIKYNSSASKKYAADDTYIASMLPL